MAEVERVDRAESEVRKIGGQYWALLGLEDPTVSANRRHIMHVFRDEPDPAAPYPVIAIEKLDGKPPGPSVRVGTLSPSSQPPVSRKLSSAGWSHWPAPSSPAPNLCVT